MSSSCWKAFGILAVALACAGCAPQARFTYTPTKGSAPLSVQFTDQSGSLALGVDFSALAPVTSWSWDFGDGETSTDASPKHIYYTEGTFDVTLTMTNVFGASTVTVAKAVKVTSAVSFTASSSAGSAPLTVQFTDTSTVPNLNSSPVNSWHWDFGDGAQSTVRNPSHVFVSPGTYTVVLQVETSDGLYTGTDSQEIVVNDSSSVTAEFSENVTAGPAPLTVQFTDLSNLAGADTADATWRWRFGDGAESTLQDPSHTYAEPGSYSVSLTVTARGQSNTTNKLNLITVESPVPAVSFTADQTAGDAPLTVQFTDTSTVPDADNDPIVAWAWDFGDGTGSTEQNPVHTYFPGTENPFSVSLTVALQSGGTYSHTESGLIALQEDLPVARFKGTPLSGVAPFEVQFEDLSVPGSEAITAWEWDFGDGGGSSVQHPVHEYTEAGVYDVTLTVTTAAGTSTMSKQDYVTVGERPSAQFTMTPDRGDPPLAIQFEDTSDPGSAPITAWAWDFGDGYTHTAQSPQHTFLHAGVFEISLTVTNTEGNDTFTDTLTVGEPVVAQFSGAPLSGAAPLPVQFTDLSVPGTDAIVAWQWDFGDGTPVSTAASPLHTYTVAGTYTVKLTVSTAPGTPYADTEEKTAYITVQ